MCSTSTSTSSSGPSSSSASTSTLCMGPTDIANDRHHSPVQPHLHYMKLTSMMPLVEECPDTIDVANLESQLAVAQNLTKRLNLETTEEFYEQLTSMKQAFPDLLCLTCIALTVPVTSATAKRSFSALKRI